MPHCCISVSLRRSPGMWRDVKHKFGIHGLFFLSEVTGNAVSSVISLRGGSLSEQGSTWANGPRRRKRQPLGSASGRGGSPCKSVPSHGPTSGFGTAVSRAWVYG